MWDVWFNDGIILVIENKIDQSPVGFCHVKCINENESDDTTSECCYESENGYIWLEGIRIHPACRGQGYGKKLVTQVEEIALQKNCNSVMMIVSSSNKPSLNLVQNLSYKAQERWIYFSTETNTGNHHLAKKHENNELKFILSHDNKINSDAVKANYYVKDWRWLKINQSELRIQKQNESIIKIYKNKTHNPALENNDDFSVQKNIHKTEKHNYTPPIAAAMVIPSDHFRDNVQVTILKSDTMASFSQIKESVQNYASKRNFHKIQFFVPEYILQNIIDKRRIEEDKKSTQFILLSKQLKNQQAPSTNSKLITLQF